MISASRPTTTSQHLDMAWHESRALRHDVGHPQRRRQPAGALPRRRRPADLADRTERRAGRRRLRGRAWPAPVAGIPADPGDHCGFTAVPAPSGAVVRTGARDRRRPVRRAVGQPRPGSPPSRPSLPRTANATASRASSTAYRQANVDAIRSSAAFVPLVRMAILAGFTCTLLLGGWATLRGDLEVGLYSVLVFMTQRLLWPLTAVAEVLDLYQRGRASARRILAPACRAGDRARRVDRSLGRGRAAASNCATSGPGTPTAPTSCTEIDMVVPGRGDARDRWLYRRRASPRCCG